MGEKHERFIRDRLRACESQVFTAEGREYVLQGLVGDGAIGVVRKAKDIKLGNQVAVKFLAPEFKYIEMSSMDDIHARFRREGLRGAALDHENLVKILSYQENEDACSFKANAGPCNPFIVMEFVRGKTLESFIRSRQTTQSIDVDSEKLHIAVEVAKALVHLHEKKLVHRDVKPANVFLSGSPTNYVPATVKLGDFGVVKWGDFKASVTTGTLTISGHPGLGTIKYMSPEQAVSPKDVSVRSDMYSFGIALFELFTNQILPSPHHVFQITLARLKRGSVAGKLYELGLRQIPSEFENLFSSVLDMFLTSPRGRPSSREMLGRLEYLLERIEQGE